MRPLQNHGGLWSPSYFPDILETSVVRLRDHVVSHIDEKGAVRAPCKGRALETALLLRLLERTGAPYNRQIAYLRSLSADADPFDLAVAKSALHRAGAVTEELRARVAAASPDFTAFRKRALVDGVFAILEESSQHDASSHSGVLQRQGLHSWAQVQVTALKGVLARTLDDEDAQVLLATQRLPEVWEGNLLIHLFTLHALRGLPGTEAVIADGVRKALRHVRADGSVPFVTDTDTWCTVTAGIALEAAGAPEPVLHRIAERLIRCQQPGGGWSFTDVALQTDVDDTSVALQFLQMRADTAFNQTIERGLLSLLAVRHPQGGFPTYVRSSAPEACMTAAALDAFTPEASRYRQVLAEGASFLARSQLEDGTFPPDWSSSQHHTVFRTVLALSRALDGLIGPAADVVRRALRFVRDSQNSDGGWGQRGGCASDPISTAYAVMALCAQEDPRPVTDGLQFLLRSQCEDGSIPSESDSIGPRPFIFQVPLLADIFTLMAFGHVRSRIENSGGRALRNAGAAPGPTLGAGVSPG